MATTVWPGERRLIDAPWSVRLALAVEGRPALEVYDASATAGPPSSTGRLR